MENKEIIKKLFKIAKNQQKILEKLSQQQEVPQDKVVSYIDRFISLNVPQVLLATNEDFIWNSVIMPSVPNADQYYMFVLTFNVGMRLDPTIIQQTYQKNEHFPEGTFNYVIKLESAIGIPHNQSAPQKNLTREIAPTFGSLVPKIKESITHMLNDQAVINVVRQVDITTNLTFPIKINVSAR